MTAQTKLTDTQTAVLKAAAGRADSNIEPLIEPLPATLRGGARTKVIEGLLARGLAADADGHILLTDVGYATIGKRSPAPKGIQKINTLDGVAKREATDDLQKLDVTAPTIRPASPVRFPYWNSLSMNSPNDICDHYWEHAEWQNGASSLPVVRALPDE